MQQWLSLGQVTEISSASASVGFVISHLVGGGGKFLEMISCLYRLWMKS